jgi:propionyl-CoA carboxylase alpha chain
VRRDVPTITKVLIANRGEIAVRIARTCRSMGLSTVAVFSDVDADALHIEACDEAVRLGGATPAESYLRIDAIVDAARRAGADAVHPGYGFLAENAAFARAVADAGLTWIGPTPEAIEAMGDKIEAKRRMADAGVPLVPGAELAADLDPDSDEVARAGAEVGFPLMVKAAAGGGGKGMRVVHAPSDLAEAVAAARREAAGAFGDDRVFLERFVESPRHVEVQVLGDTHGTVVHLFERECSIQRRHQKVVEESPSPGIDDAVRTALGEAAVAAAEAIGYVNAGTVEFIADETVLARRRAGEDVDPRDAFAFLEVNTRLQVEHPVTEEVVRVHRAIGGLEPVDLVRLQLLVAMGEPLPFAQDDLVQFGHAIEVRLYAEDPANGYLPATGTLAAFAPAAAEGVRYDLGIREGDTVSTYYDPMLAKVVATAPTRREAASRLARALDRTVLHGTTTNRDLLVAVLRDEAFLAGDTTTAFLDERYPDDHVRRFFGPSDADVEVALVAAALAGAVARRAAPSERSADPRGNGARVLATLPVGFTNTDAFQPEVTFEVGGWHRRVRYRQERGGAWTVWPSLPDDRDAEAAAVGDGRRVLLHAAGQDGHLDVELDGHRQRVRVVGRDGDLQVLTASGRVMLRELPRFPDTGGEEVAGATLSPMPGAVVTVAVEEGQAVAKGELLVTVEAMKMEHRVTAPFDGTVAEVRVTAGQQVDADQILVVVEQDPDAA